MTRCWIRVSRRGMRPGHVWYSDTNGTMRWSTDQSRWYSSKRTTWAEIDLMMKSHTEADPVTLKVLTMPQASPASVMQQAHQNMARVNRVSLVRKDDMVKLDAVMDQVESDLKELQDKPKIRGPHKCHCPKECTSLLWGNGCRCNGL